MEVLLVVLFRMGGQNVVVGSSWCLNYTVRPLRSFRVPPPLVMMEKSCFSVTAVSQESEAAPPGSVLVASAADVLLPVQRGATVKPASGEDGQACRQDRPSSSSSHSLSSSSSPLCLYPIALTAASLSLSLPSQSHCVCCITMKQRREAASLFQLEREKEWLWAAALLFTTTKDILGQD